jgi:predicted SAM-dependent methyltransferase
MRRLWKKLPIDFRNYAHKKIHRFNSSPVLLHIFFVRHYITVRKIRNSISPVWLRIGESRTFSGWVSTNYQVITRNFLDATKFYGSECCEVIFADNVIEHLDKRSGELLVKNAYNSLISGGILRITTPDLESIVNKYLEGSADEVKQLASDLEEHNLDIQRPSDLLRITFSAFGHHKGIIYDFNSMNELLESVGFSGVKKYTPGVSSKSNLHNLESRVGKSDMWSQMAIEATKP